MAADATISLGIIIEKRKIDHPWQDYRWQPVGVIVNAEPIDTPRVMIEGEDFTQYHGATLPVELFKGETDGYLVNLSQETPSVFVVMRADDEADGGYAPFLATVCPYEAESYGESGDEIVEGVAMPPELLVWLKRFVDVNHVETPFRKRKNKKHRTEIATTRPRGRYTPEAQ